MKPKEFFNQNGFYIAKSISPKELVDEYISDYRKIFIQQLEFLGDKTSQSLATFDLMQSLFNKDLKRYLSTLVLSGKLFSLYNLYSHQNVVNVIKEFGIKIPAWQTRPMMHSMANELKIPNGYHGVGVHQDWPTLQSSINIITVWIPFTKVTKDNFPMEVVPGSNKLGLLEGTQTAHYFETDPKYYKTKDFIPLECDVGDVVFMCNFTIHRSQTEGNGFRLSASTRYEDAGDKTFAERNYPYTEHRVVKRDVLFPGFPSLEQVKKCMEGK